MEPLSLGGNSLKRVSPKPPSETFNVLFEDRVI
jgi:hypothetical protein